MSYIENPKTRGSGIMCCIPQAGICPIGCEDCFFQSGRSYLEPLSENCPNMPSVAQTKGCIVRVNDGNDSNNDPEAVMAAVEQYEHVFYNTSIASNLENFDAPVVLTVNPAEITDHQAILINAPTPPNLMFVRVRVNTWNLRLVDKVVNHYGNCFYSKREVPIVLTFMAYRVADKIPDDCQEDYSIRMRTLNKYFVITPKAWNRVMDRYRDNRMVYSCGKDALTFSCSRCGNCLREYFCTLERLKALTYK